MLTFTVVIAQMLLIWIVADTIFFLFMCALSGLTFAKAFRE